MVWGTAIVSIAGGGCGARRAQAGGLRYAEERAAMVWGTAIVSIAGGGCDASRAQARGLRYAEERAVSVRCSVIVSIARVRTCASERARQNAGVRTRSWSGRAAAPPT